MKMGVKKPDQICWIHPCKGIKKGTFEARKMGDHKRYMQRCIELAGMGLGQVAPNPMVGAVLVCGGEIISEGFHGKYGEAHAEVNALQKVKDSALLARSTLYVNLEPCSHHGKTPPCSALIISKKIPRVVIANSDPNPLVAGSGIRQLKKAGVEVITGVLQNEGAHLNRRFFTAHLNKRPFIILKWAQTAGGIMAPFHAQGIRWISNESSRRLVHIWRSEEQAILTSVNTVMNDNPQLTVRKIRGRNPVKVVIDPTLKLDHHYRIFQGSTPVLVFNSINDSTKGNVQNIKIKGRGREFLLHLLQKLMELEVHSLLVEGGSVTLNSFLESGLWDEARVFTGKVNFDKGIPAPAINRKADREMHVDGDLLEIYHNR